MRNSLLAAIFALISAFNVDWVVGAAETIRPDAPQVSAQQIFIIWIIAALQTCMALQFAASLQTLALSIFWMGIEANSKRSYGTACQENGNSMKALHMPSPDSYGRPVDFAGRLSSQEIFAPGTTSNKHWQHKHPGRSVLCECDG